MPSAPALDCTLDDVRGDIKRDVLPDPHDKPTRIDECVVGRMVACHGALELVGPEGGVAFGTGGVLRARVPVAAVDKDSDAWAREDDVGADAPGWCMDRVVFAEPQAPTMQQRPQHDLGAGVGATVRAHRPSHTLGTRRRPIDGTTWCDGLGGHHRRSAFDRDTTERDTLL